MTDLFFAMSPKADIAFDILVTQQSKNNQTEPGKQPMILTQRRMKNGFEEFPNFV